MGQNDRTRLIPQDEFFRMNQGKLSREKFSEEVYRIVHTTYLTDVENYKKEIGRLWRERFDVFLTEESFEYLRKNNAEFIRPVVIQRIKNAETITCTRNLTRALTGIEFDLWLVEQSRAEAAYSEEHFNAYLKEKYGNFLELAYKNFKKYDLAFARDYERLAASVAPYYEELKVILSRMTDASRAFIMFQNESANRQEHYEFIHKVNQQTDFNDRNPKSMEPEQTATQQSQSVAVPTQDNMEYDLILREKDERITRLEKDIKEFKRQRDELREYAVNQYDKGVKDLFSLMNDKRYGKIMDYFYAVSKDDSTEDSLASYLDNLFMVLEDMEIEPIIAKQDDVLIDEANLTRDYNLDFDKKEYVQGQETVKYVGWKYKGMIIEKPTLTKKGK